VKYFCNARNAIPYIQDIKIINAFRDGVSDIKTVEEIAMKKPKPVADLLAVADIYIEALEARAWLLESRNKGPSKKKQQEDWEVNIVDCVERDNCGNHRNRQQHLADQKEKRPFQRPADTEKWCEIHRTARHNLEECKNFLECKKMLEKPATQEPQRGEHRRTDPDNEDQMDDDINVIFRGSLSITSKIQGKKFEREISLAQRIELKRRMKWSKTGISFGPKEHPEI
jgi:hypothetical protein